MFASPPTHSLSHTQPSRYIVTATERQNGISAGVHKERKWLSSARKQTVRVGDGLICGSRFVRVCQRDDDYDERRLRRVRLTSFVAGKSEGLMPLKFEKMHYAYLST